MRESLYRLAKAMRNYRHPMGLVLQRLARRPAVYLQDRRTGLAFRCLQGADHLFGDVFHARLYDVPLAPVSPGDLVIDVGANHGFAACYFAHRGAEVIAFEPSPRVFPLLEENVARNHLTSRVRPIRAAVAAADGTTSLRETDCLGGGMSTIEPEFARASGAAYGSAVEVETRSLTGLLRELAPRRVRLLKLDCEGSEFAILATLSPEDRRQIDSIALEYHPPAYPLASLVDLLLGWEGFHLAKVPETDTSNANLQIVRREAIRRWAEGDGSLRLNATGADAAGARPAPGAKA